MNLVAGQSIERYVVERQLGSGGMATVWLLRHKHLGTQHALKVLTHVGAGAELRLMLEGKVQAALRHPNIVAVTDILDVGGTPGLLMEYVPPPSLAVWLAAHQPTIDEAESLFRGIVDGVRHAHRYGLVHRDLKPSNVLLARYEGEGLVPKVADFGLAKLLSDDAVAGQTRSGLTMGTPQYMAPEQIRDAKKVDRRADMFSLGCILYELLAGQPPYAWTDFITLYNQLMAREFRPLPAHIPEPLAAAVSGLLEPERGARIADCDTLLAVLDGRELPTSPTVTPANLGRLVDIPVLRDRGEPAPDTFGPPSGSAQTLAADPTLDGALALDTSPRPLPMPEVVAAPPTMIPPADSLVVEAAVVPSLPPGESPFPSRRSRLWIPGALGLGVLVLALILRRSEAPGPPPAKPAPKAEASPPSTPPAPPTASPPTAPEPGAPVLTAAAAAAKPAPAPPRVDPTPPRVEKPTVPLPVSVVIPAPVPEPPRLIAVTADTKGDATRVDVVGPGGSFTLPAEVPPGSYEIYAWFADAPRTHTGSLSVDSGDRVALRCLSFSMSCSRR